MIDELLNFNKTFVETKGYEKYITNKYPDKKIAIATWEVTVANRCFIA
jgi:carbonic anhydrase